MIKHCIFRNPVNSYFYDGTEESAKFVEKNFADFKYQMWKKDHSEKGMMLIYHGSDSQGEYENIVPPNVFIVEFQMRSIITDWFDTKEFEDKFIVKE